MRKPFYWLNETSRKFLNTDEGYISKGETPEGRIREIAETAERILGIDGFADTFYDRMSKGWYSLSTPVWTNFGKKRGMPVSCFNSHITDDIGGIKFADAEVGVMSKLGGGTSGYFGEIRPRGSDITDNGQSSGAVHFMELFQTTTDVISQGNSRRGRMSPYLPLSHGDIKEFLEIGTEGHAIQDMNHGVVADDEWIQSMLDGDKEKRQIWARVIQRRAEIGYPYILFRDNANKAKPDVYKETGKVINSSNLCVAPFTMVEIRVDGVEHEIEIIGLNAIFQENESKNLDKTIEVKSFNTETGMVEYKRVLASAKTSNSAKVMQITDEATGKSIVCTPDHKVYTSNRGYVMAKDLKEYDVLVIG